MRIELDALDRYMLASAQEIVTREHYLHAPVDSRCSVEGYMISIIEDGSPFGTTVGYFILGRPQATAVKHWYGNLENWLAGKCEVTYWQVLNLARVYLFPDWQPGGQFYGPEHLPGFVDRKGDFRSTLASRAIIALLPRVGYDYLMLRPPCFPDEPYEIRWLMSYCDTRLHKGTIYKAAGFELCRTNKAGIQTWRIRLPGLSNWQDERVKEASKVNARSQRYRAERMQMKLEI